MRDDTHLRHRCAPKLPRFDDERSNRFLHKIATTDPALLPLVASDPSELLAGLRERPDAVVRPADFTRYGFPETPFADRELVLAIARSLFIDSELRDQFRLALSNGHFATATRTRWAGR